MNTFNNQHCSRHGYTVHRIRRARAVKRRARLLFESHIELRSENDCCRAQCVLWFVHNNCTTAEKKFRCDCTLSLINILQLFMYILTKDTDFYRCTKEALRTLVHKYLYTTAIFF